MRETTPESNLAVSFKRSKKFSAARVKNVYYLKNVWHMIKEDSEDELHYPLLLKYKDRLETCARLSLYRTANKGRQSTLITGLTCNHRLCNICNMIRSRKLRRKWSSFLQDDTRDILIRRRQCHMFGLDYGCYSHKENPQYTSGAEIMQKFDMMHLTLTMPHTGGRWNDREYYAAELLKKFHLLRQSKWWLDVVFGGEYTIETTLSANGLHIHLHALVLTDKQYTGSRNYLYENIFLSWNRLTVNYSDTRSPVITDEKRIAGIMATHADWNKNKQEFLDKILPHLDARGATMVGLKSLYHEIPYSKVNKFNSNTVFKGDDGRYFHYCKSGNAGSMLKGVVECLKYHFEPCALEQPGEPNLLNQDLLKAVLPNIYRQRLYGKFGGFYGVKQLNVMEDPVSITDLQEDLQDTGKDIFDPATGGGIETSEYHYRILDARNVALDEEKKHTLISRKKTKMILKTDEFPTTRDAIQVLTHIGLPKK